MRRRPLQTNISRFGRWLFAAVFLVASSGCRSAPSSGPEPTTIDFSVSIPRKIGISDRLQIAGSFNGWDPEADGYALARQSDYQYATRLTFDEAMVGTTIEYKYVLLLDGQTEDPWTYVEGTSVGGETSNRRYQIKQGAQTVNDDIQTFKNHTGLTSLTRGTLQFITLDMVPYTDGRTRRLRIWLPDGYDPEDTEKKYPVLYMHDGQNLFDRYTSFAGEWKIDETIGAMMDEGYGGTIVVGIDNSADRLNELSPSWPIGTSAYETMFNDTSGEKYAEFIVATVKPYVDAHFNTDPGKDQTGIGGSSMGGIISFYMAMTYPEVFGYALIFSPAMYVYQTETLNEFLEGMDFSKSSDWPRLYVYAGGLETTITPYVDIIKNGLIDHGYDGDKIATLVDPNKNHNESAWSQYFPVAYRWLVGL